MEKELEATSRDAEEMGCFGLVNGWAKNLYTHRDFHASLCSKKDGPFYCPVCRSDALVHKCVEISDYFAHAARLSPVIGAMEGALHNSCKLEILSRLNERHPEGNWAAERVIPENKSKSIPELRPDISGRIRGHPIAIEVQASALTIGKIVKRSKDYAKRGIAILWLVPLREPLGDQPFRPRLYERYLHSIYFGRTYYWWPGLGLTLKPVHYAIASRHVDYREWYEGGSQMTGGGYDVDYRIIKTPEYGVDVVIDSNFCAQRRDEFTPENERKAVPSSFIWRDELPPWWNDY